MKRVTLQSLLFLTASAGSMPLCDAKSAALQLSNAWNVYAPQRSRYEKQPSRSQRQNRKANRRAFPHGFTGRAA